MYSKGHSSKGKNWQNSIQCANCPDFSLTCVLRCRVEVDLDGLNGARIKHAAKNVTTSGASCLVA